MRRWVALAIGVGVGAAFLPYLGTRYEYVYAPILISTDVRNVVQEPDGDLCWDWTFVKVRRARPLGFHYSVTATNLAATPVVFRRRETPVSTVEHPLGTATDHYCVRLPRTLADVGPVRLEGYAVYTVPHGLWVVEQPLPTIVYPPRERSSG